jgi:hypothetical protein
MVQQKKRDNKKLPSQQKKGAQRISCELHKCNNIKIQGVVSSFEIFNFY